MLAPLSNDTGITMCALLTIYSFAQRCQYCNDSQPFIVMVKGVDTTVTCSLDRKENETAERTVSHEMSGDFRANVF